MKEENKEKSFFDHVVDVIIRTQEERFTLNNLNEFIDLGRQINQDHEDAEKWRKYINQMEDNFKEYWIDKGIPNK